MVSVVGISVQDYIFSVSCSGSFYQSVSGHTMVDENKVDISREFTCFLSNGIATLLGTITLESNFVRLSTPG